MFIPLCQLGNSADAGNSRQQRLMDAPAAPRFQSHHPEWRDAREVVLAAADRAERQAGVLNEI